MFHERTRWDSPLRQAQDAGLTTCYHRCETTYAKRRSGNDWKRVSHNQIMEYDTHNDCYKHVHHQTCTVRISRDRYQVSTGGWDTVSTWAKIREYCPIHTFKPTNANIMHTRLVGWGDYKGRGYEHFVPFYDGIEVDGDGVPLKMEPCKFQRIHRKEMDAFNANVRIVRDKLRTRMLVGEWDDAPRMSYPSYERVVEAFAKLAQNEEWIDHDLVRPLFMRRFADDEEGVIPCAVRFENMVKFGRQAPSLKETYTKECF